MLIRSFGLERYGSFEDREVTFGPGLTVVIGDNETGKSTTLSGLADLLWGFRRGHRDYSFSTGRLSLTADLELPDGRQVRVRRRGTGLQTIPDGSPFDPLWGPPEPDARDQWRRAFGLSQRELREGGSRVFEGSGDLAELVFAARSGRAVHQLVRTLQAESEALYKTHRGNKRSPIRLAWAESDRLQGEAKAAMSSGQAVQEAEQEQARRQLAARTAQTRLAAATRAHTEAEQRRRALPEVQAMLEARAARDQLLATGMVLTPEQVTALSDADETSGVTAADVRRLLAAIETERENLAALPVDERLLADNDEITRLQRLVEARVGDTGQAEQDDRRAEELTARARALLAELVGPQDQHPVEELLSALHVPVDVAADLDALSTRIATLRDELARADQSVQTAEERERAAAPTLAATRDPLLVVLLREVVTAIDQEGSATRAQRTAADQAAGAYADRRDALRRAGAQLPEAEPSVLPGRDALRTAREQRVKADAEVARCDGEHASAERAVDTARTQLAAATRKRLPDPGQLAQTRAHRADLWDRLVTAAAGGLTPERAAELLPSLALATSRADEIADDLIEHASAATKQAQKQRLLEEAEQHRTATVTAAAAAHIAAEQAHQQWDGFWRDLGLTPPTVDAADDAYRALDEAHQAHTTLLAAERRITALTGQAEAQRATLTEALARLGHPYPDADLDTALAAAGHLLAEDDGAREVRASAATHAAATAHARTARTRAESDLTEALRAWADTQQRWATTRPATAATATGPATWPPSVMTADGWTAWHTGLAQAQTAHHSATEARDRAAAARGRIETFAQDITVLADRHGENTADTPTDTLDRLATRLGTASRNLAAAETVRRVIGDLSTELADAHTRHGLAITAVAKHRAEAGLPDDEPLPPVLERSHAAHTWQDREATSAARIRATAPDHHLEDLVDHLATRDEATLDQELEAARDHRDACAAAQTEADNACGASEALLRQLQEKPSVNVLLAQSREHLALVAERAESYLVTTMQYRLLRDQLEAYESRHASPLLDAAGRVLERLTGGFCVGLRAIEQGNQRFLRVVRADEVERQPGELSEGTADQVYLALRLAAISQLQNERIARGEVPLPVALDDILITFDDRRAAATLRVLAELARNWQIIVFTHHDHLAEIIRSFEDPNLGESVRISRLAPVVMPADLRDADQIRASLVQWTDGSTDAHPTPDTQPPPERPTSGRRTPPAAADHDAGDIRAWARAHGYEVSDRGRIAQSIQDAYHQAQHA